MNPTDSDIPSSPLCRVVCAAIRHPETGVILAGFRHYDNATMRPILKELTGGDTNNKWYAAEQGFVDNKGEFLTRAQAWKVAEAAGQIRQITGTKGTLYSEDLY